MQTQNGFTLIELMMVVAIIAILAAVAYPSYNNSVAKARRSDAQGALQGLAQAMERFYTENGTYEGAAGTTATPANTGAPRIFAVKSPIDGGGIFYNLRITASGSNSYSLAAVPAGAQANDGALVLLSTGRRGWDSDNSGGGNPSGVGNTEWCWKKSC